MNSNEENGRALTDYTINLASRIIVLLLDLVALFIPGSRVNSSAPQMDFSDSRTVKHMKCALATARATAVSKNN
jgi:hypothetical protein